MREILFKAKRIDNGDWIEGYYQKRYERYGDVKHYIFWTQSYTIWEYAEIDPETLCQYTGLKDKDGNRIWEKDIVLGDRLNIGINKKYLIKYSEEESCLKIKEFKYGEEYYACKSVLKRFGGVGNIFDNLELLERS